MNEQLEAFYRQPPLFKYPPLISMQPQTNLPNTITLPILDFISHSFGSREKMCIGQKQYDIICQGMTSEDFMKHFWLEVIGKDEVGQALFWLWRKNDWLESERRREHSRSKAERRQATINTMELELIASGLFDATTARNTALKLYPSKADNEGSGFLSRYIVLVGNTILSEKDFVG